MCRMESHAKPGRQAAGYAGKPALLGRLYQPSNGVSSKPQRAIRVKDAIPLPRLTSSVIPPRGFVCFRAGVIPL